MLVTRLRVAVEEFEAGSGWSLQSRGACRGGVCISLPADAVVDGSVDVAAVAARLGMPIIEDAEAGLWAVGPETSSGHALASAEAADLTLADLDGDEFHLSSLRGQKVVIVAWAPY